MEWDKKDNLNKPPSQRTSKHLNDLVGAITSCGVSFNVWEKMDGDGKGSGIYDFTSLMGSDKKVLLTKLPDKLGGIIQPETSEAIVNIWKVGYLGTYCKVLQWSLTSIILKFYENKYVFL